MNKWNNMETELIILRSVFGKVGIKYYIMPTKDPESDEYPACVKQVDSKGDMILTEAERNSKKIFIPVNRVFVLQDGSTFNLNNPRQRAEWEAIQFSPVIALSRDQRDAKGNLVIDGDARRYGTAELYVERPGYITNKKISKRKLIHDAEDYIFNDPKGSEGRLFIAKLLGRTTKGVPDPEIQDYLLDIAQSDPERIINMYRADDISYRLLFIDAKEKHVIVIKNKVYVYGDSSIVLGATDDAVVEWMQRPSNAKVVEMIRKDTYPEMYQSSPKTKAKDKEESSD